MKLASVVRVFWSVGAALLIALAIPSLCWAGEDPGGDDVPQFDLSMAGAALTLVAGGMLALKGRRSRHQSP